MTAPAKMVPYGATTGLRDTTRASLVRGVLTNHLFMALSSDRDRLSLFVPSSLLGKQVGSSACCQKSYTVVHFPITLPLMEETLWWIPPNADTSYLVQCRFCPSTVLPNHPPSCSDAFAQKTGQAEQKEWRARTKECGEVARSSVSPSRPPRVNGHGAVRRWSWRMSLGHDMRQPWLTRDTERKKNKLTSRSTCQG